VNAFEQYARFISGRYDIAVVLDGVKAETDGRTISLPNLETLTPDELDLLYGILLHEVGHIRHTDFSAAAFGQLRTTAEAIMANAIEDARSENILIGEFDGARDIFYQLYHGVANSPEMMERLFRGSVVTSDTWFAIGRLVHARLHRLDLFSTVTPCITPATLALAEAFLSTKGFDTRLTPDSVKTWSDVISLTRALADAFFAGTDLSDPVRVGEQSAARESASEFLDTLHQRIAQSQQDVTHLEEAWKDAKKLQKESAEHLSSRADTLTAAWEPLASNLSELQLQSSLEERRAKLQAREERTHSTARAAEQRLHEKHRAVVAQQASKRAALDDTMADLDAERQIFRSSPPKAGSSTKDVRQFERQLAALNSRMAKLEDKRNEISHPDPDSSGTPLQQKRATDTRKKAQAVSQELAEVQQQLDSQAQKTAVASSDLQAQMQHLSERVSRLGTELLDIQRQQQVEALSVRDAHERVVAARDSVQKATVDGLTAAEEAMQAAGLPAGTVLPQLQPTPGWESVDTAQAQFDEQASREGNTHVVAGVGTMPGNRNILTRIDQSRHDVAELDIGQLFYDTLGVDSIEEFGQALGSGVPLGSSGPDPLAVTARPYRVFSQQYDSVRPLGPVSPEEMAVLHEDRLAQRDAYARLQRLFQARFAFARRDRFHGNQEEGDLDSRSLWKLASRMGDDFHEVNRPIPVNRTAATILCDMSGSLDTDQAEHGALIRRLALGISDALTKTHVTHEILGFSAPVEPELLARNPSPAFGRRIHRLEHVLFKGFRDRTAEKLALFEVGPSDNADGESLRFAWQRLKRQAARRRVLFYLTDGKPWLAGGDATQLDADVRDAVRQIQQEKGHLIAISLDRSLAALVGPSAAVVHSVSDVVPAFERLLPPRA